MANLAFEYLNIVPFSEISLWDFKRYQSGDINSSYEVVKLSKYIKEESMRIKPFEIPDENFEILGVNNKTGLFDAYIEKGEKINQPYKIVKDGFLAYNPYRINVRSIGLKTKEHKYKYISPAYVVFSCKEGLLPEFLYILFRTEAFNILIRENTTGSVRQTLSFTSMCNIKIPLPSLEEQKRIVEAYNAKIKLAQEQDHQAQTLEKQAEEYLFEELGLQINDEAKSNSKYNLLNFAEFKSISLWGLDKIYGIDKFKSLKYKLASIHSMPELAKDVFRGKSPKYDEASASVMLNQKCVRWDEIELQHAKNVDSEWLNQIDKYNLTKEGDILINSTGEGTIGRATCITNKLENLLYDSHILLLRLSKEMVNPKFSTMIINSNFGQEQINHIKSAQSTKQTELGVENLKKIKFPLPPLEIQNKIVKKLTDLKDQIKTLKTQSETNRTTALEEFEKELFE